MVEAVALITALQALAYMIATMKAPVAALTIFDHFSEDQSFNLATYLDAQTFADVCKGFKEPWDGNVFSFPFAVVKLLLRAVEGK